MSIKYHEEIVKKSPQCVSCAYCKNLSAKYLYTVPREDVCVHPDNVEELRALTAVRKRYPYCESINSKEGILVNSDINGAGNILRKVIGDVVYDQPIVVLMLNPIKFNFNKDF